MYLIHPSILPESGTTKQLNMFCLTYAHFITEKYLPENKIEVHDGVSIYIFRRGQSLCQLYKVPAQSLFSSL